MGRVLMTIAFELVLTALLALGLLITWESVHASSLGDDVARGARTLVYFADIVYYLWAPSLLIVAIVRRRTLGVRGTLLLVAGGAVLNVVVVLAIGFAQEGRVASFVAIAVQGSLAVLLAALIVVPLTHRAISPPNGLGGRAVED